MMVVKSNMPILFTLSSLFLSIFSSCSAVNTTVGDNGPVPEGSAARLTCDYVRNQTSSVNLPLFTWKEISNGSLVIISTYQSGVGFVHPPYRESGRFTAEGDSTLVIANVNRSDNDRIFQCEISIVDDTPSTSTDDLKLSVVFYGTMMFKIISSPATEGGSVMFLCSVDANPIPNIFVYKDETEITTETITNLTYKIDSVVRSDGGNYRCKTSNIAGNGTSQIEQLDVYYHDTIMFEITNPVIEGKSTKFVCSVDANPTEEIVLSKDDTEIKKETTTNLTHIIDSVEKSDRGNYECTAIKYDDSSRSEIKQLDVYFHGTMMINITNPATEEQSTTFVCSIDANPIPDIFLYKDETEIKTETTTILTHTIDSVARSDGGNYKCDANNIYGSGISISPTEQLDVYYIDELRFEITPNPATEGKSTMFKCSIDANPIPEIVLWKDETEIKKETTTNLTHIIDSVTRSDRGNYKCTASNGRWKNEQLDVYYKPKIQLDEEHTAGPGQDVVISLNVSANPNYITYQWTTYPPGINDTDNDPAEFTFIASEVDGTNYTITVNVTNSIGSTTKSVKVTVSKPPCNKQCKNNGICVMHNNEETCECPRLQDEFCETNQIPDCSCTALKIGISVVCFICFALVIYILHMKFCQRTPVDRRSTETLNLG